MVEKSDKGRTRDGEASAGKAKEKEAEDLRTQGMTTADRPIEALSRVMDDRGKLYWMYHGPVLPIRCDCIVLSKGCRCRVAARFWRADGHWYCGHHLFRPAWTPYAKKGAVRKS